MLSEVSWTTYGTLILIAATGYYLVVGIMYYRTDAIGLLSRLTGRKFPGKSSSANDFPVPDYEIMGPVSAEPVGLVEPEAVTFAATKEDELTGYPADVQPVDIAAMVSDFSEMIAEAKTLVRVIKECDEPKENFEMLYRLVIRKYPVLKGTAYQQKVDDFLLAESSSFPFALTAAELTTYWDN